MHTFSYYFQYYWLPFVLMIGLVAAGILVYKNWDRIVIKDSEKK